MTDLHRTQVLLTKWQYRRLKERAKEEGVSLSEIVRRTLDEGLSATRRQSKERLREIRGMFSDGSARGEDHDAVLYGGDEPL